MALCALTLLMLGQAPAFTGIRNDLSLDALYPDKSYSGKTANQITFSPDDRYIAYMWNGYDDHGMDIWLYDTQTKSSRRLTSIDMFVPFDRDTKSVAARYKRQKEEADRKKKEQEEKAKGGAKDGGTKSDDGKKPDVGDEPVLDNRGEPWSDSSDGIFQDLDPQQRGRRFGGGGGPGAMGDYSGPSEYEWAHNSNKMLLTYRGDVYMLDVSSDAAPVRLTQTQEPESGLQWTKADDGYFFRRATGVFKMTFHDSFVRQLNPSLPGDLQMGWYSISPDETKLAMSATKTTAEDRSVSYIVYRDRFAEARTTPRGVADDIFNSESHLYLYDLNDDPVKNPDNDGKPWEVYFWPAGKEYGQTSLAPDPWTKDGSKFVFASWKRDKKEFQVLVADTKTKKTDTVYTETLMGGHTTPGRAEPMFLPNGQILVNTDKSGFMQLWTIDPAAKTAKEVTSGNFETEVVSVAKDGSWALITADNENSARVGAFKANLATGALEPVAHGEGVVTNPMLSHDERTLVYSWKSWHALPELYTKSATPADDKVQLTKSHHADEFWKTQKIEPKLFSFTNRHGQTVHGYMYLPPDFKKGEHRPLWMYTYGGPLSARGKDVLDGNFNSFNMYMAYKYGYITCTVDPRGMSGYGGAWESANWETPGTAQVEDLSDAVKWFETNYGIDRDKVGINGWSFGGFQTQMCMYTAPDVFKLGIAGAGPVEWQNYNTWYTGGVIGFSRSNTPSDLDKFSLTKICKNLKSPMMLLHGMEDTNVLYQDTVKVYRSLLAANKGSLIELVVDPTGQHGLGGDIKTKDRYLIYEGYLNRHWGPYKKRK